MKFKTQYNQGEFPRVGEKNEKPSATVPDMSLSIREILDRYARGIPMNVKKGKYDEEEEDDAFYSIDVSNLDLAEKEELARQAKAEVDRLRKVLNDKAAAKRLKDEREAKEKQLKELQETKDEVLRKEAKPKEGTNNT